MTLKLLQPAEIQLHAPHLNERAAGQSGGKSGEKSEVSYEHNAGKVEIETNMTKFLEAQTLLRFSTGGGGGWGEEVTEED